MKTLIVGTGQVGQALREILEDYYETEGIDGEKIDFEPEIMHICFPYSDSFVEEVKRYQEQYDPQYTVIHSTVPPGTSRKCNSIHSPVRGIHPNLKEGLLTFKKFIGGEDASEVADYFRRAGMKVYLTDSQEATELIKIDSTNWYGLCIEKTKDTKRLCDKHDVPFELFSLWTEDYNEGYEELGHPEYKRPNLVPIMKEIGGHCVLDNLGYLKSKFTKLVKKLQP